MMILMISACKTWGFRFDFAGLKMILTKKMRISMKMKRLMLIISCVLVHFMMFTLWNYTVNLVILKWRWGLKMLIYCEVDIAGEPSDGL